MARKGENIYKRKDGRFEGRYKKGYDSEGNLKWGSVYGKTYTEAKEKLALKKVEAKVQNNIISSSALLQNWIEKWIVTQKHIKPTTRMMYYSHLKNHIKGSIGNIMLKRLTADVIQKFVDNETEKYEPKTVHAVFSMLKLALKAAKSKGYMANIYSDIKLPKVRRKVLRVFTPQEQKRFEKAIQDSNNRYDIGILLCLYTGMRIGELCALRWENIDLENGTLYVLHTAERVLNDDKKSKKKTKISIDEPKSDTSTRQIPIRIFLLNCLLNMKGQKVIYCVTMATTQTVETYHDGLKNCLRLQGCRILLNSIFFVIRLLPVHWSLVWILKHFQKFLVMQV